MIRPEDPPELVEGRVEGARRPRSGDLRPTVEGEMKEVIAGTLKLIDQSRSEYDGSCPAMSFSIVRDIPKISNK